MIVDVADGVERGVRSAAVWHRQGVPDSMSVNVSMRQLETDSLVDDVSAALR